MPPHLLAEPDHAIGEPRRRGGLAESRDDRLELELVDRGGGVGQGEPGGGAFVLLGPLLGLPGHREREDVDRDRLD